jgi:hypothetical protein
MKNDLFFMATAILNVWKLGSCKDYCVGVLADKDNEDYKIFVLDNQKDQLELILDIFGDSSI